MELGRRLKELRKAKGLTQTRLAELLGVHLQTVSKWERGVNEPDISLLGEIASVLGASVEELLGAPLESETFSGTFDAAALGNFIRASRKSLGENQETLAQAVGTTGDTVSKWERGVVCPGARELKALSEHFSVPLSRLYYGILPEEKTASVPVLKRRRRLSFSLIAVSVIVCITAVLLAVLLPGSTGSLPETVMCAVTVGEEQIFVAEGEWFTPASPASRPGYEFKGYTDENGVYLSFPIQINSDSVIYTIYEPVEYTVDYWLNGGTVSGGLTTEVTVESGVLVLPVPEKSGTAFAGWYLTPDYSGDPVSEISVSDDPRDMVVYARWESEVFTVRYELGGGAMIGANPTEVSSNEAHTLTDAVRSGYIFLGWFDAREGGSRVTSVGGEGARNLVLYARWQRSNELYAVRYELGGGSFTSPNPEQVSSGSTVLLAPAERTGYDFKCWNTAPDGSGTTYTSLTGLVGDLTLYAVWTPKVYSVVYEPDGGSTDNPNHITFGESVTLSPAVKPGYDFVGWFDAQSGGNEITTIDEENILTLTRLYARYTPKVFAVTLDAAGGVVPGVNAGANGSYTLFVTYGTDPGLPAPAARTGYDFKEWNTAADGGGSTYISLAGLRGDLALYAVWTPKVYIVTYDTGGGEYEGVANPNNITFGESVTLVPVSKFGYHFAGWYDAETGGNRITTIDDSNILSLTRLYARFVPQKFEVSLDAAGGVIPGVEADGEGLYTVVAEYGTDLELPVPERADYDFVGWMAEDGEAVSVIDRSNIREGIKLTAEWVTALPETYDIIYDHQSNGVTYKGDNPDRASNTQSVLLDSPVRPGYKFMGWFDDPDGRGTRYEATPLGIRGTLTLYAVWQQDPETATESYFTATLSENSAVVTKYTGPAGADADLLIPETIGGKPVVAVNGLTGEEQAEFRSVTLPSELESIGDGAFAGVTVHGTIFLPASLTHISPGAFRGCSAGSLVFDQDSMMTEIGDEALRGLTLDEPLVLPKSVTRIGIMSMPTCTSVVLPDGLISIGASAFSFPAGKHCEIFLPASVQEVGMGAFGVAGSGAYVFTPLSSSAIDLADTGAKNIAYDSDPSNVILTLDGEEYARMSGGAYYLPTPEKPGHIFMGWQDEDDKFVPRSFIPRRDGETVTLTAVWEPRQNATGSGSRMMLDEGEELPLIVAPEDFYGDSMIHLMLNAPAGAKVRVTVKAEIADDLMSGEYGLYIIHEWNNKGGTPAFNFTDENGSSSGDALGAVYNGEWLTSEAVNGYHGQYVYYRVTISFEILS